MGLAKAIGQFLTGSLQSCFGASAGVPFVSIPEVVDDLTGAGQGVHAVPAQAEDEKDEVVHVKATTCRVLARYLEASTSDATPYRGRCSVEGVILPIADTEDRLEPVVCILHISAGRERHLRMTRLPVPQLLWLKSVRILRQVWVL